MAGSYLSNLISAFGEVTEGPDPNRLEGLLEILRGADQDGESLAGHLQRMRNRIEEAARERQISFEERRHQLNSQLADLIESNVSACWAIEAALTELLQGITPEGIDKLASASESFLQSGRQISELATQTPLCPACGAGPEQACECGLDRLIPDPDTQHWEYNQAPVSEEFFAVYEAYAAVVEGRAGLAPLMGALQSLEFSLLEAQALAEQAAEDSPPHQQLLDVINEALDGVNRVHAVSDNRLTRELHEGWNQIFRAGMMVQDLQNTLLGGNFEPEYVEDEEEQEFFEVEDEQSDAEED